MAAIRGSLVVVLVAALAGCGFHLRGQQVARLSAELGAVHVAAAPALVEAFRREIEAGGGRLVERVAEADLRITLSPESFARHTLSVDAQTGKASEYELRYRVTYSAATRGGETVVEAAPFELTRNFVFDRGALISKGREEGLLREELRREAANQILRRVSAGR